uniref:4Fe-4S dicluster domain-containing protein n=1 Tax=Vibrio algicola TaxID=2662262 RepID=A0A5Q0TJI9_9VIBR
MGLDVDIIKTRAKGDFRLSKVRGECMISVRVPGGIMPAHLLSVAQNIAETWGNGVIHLTTRQKLAMPGIRYQDIDAVNKALEPFIKDISIDMCDVGIIGIAKMTFDASRCIGCGECVLACPTMAWQRDAKQLYMVKLGGRTSKKTPRVGKTFLKWVTEDVIQGVIKNILAFEEEMLKGEPVYLLG